MGSVGARMTFIVVSILLLFTATNLATAGNDTTATIWAVRASGKIRIDGRLDDEVWSHAPRLCDFVQREPDEGKPPTESTCVMVAYDDRAIYFGIELFDSEPRKIVRQLTRRDRWIRADDISVTIDSYHDHKTAYGFRVYASGTQRDTYYYNDGEADSDWDAVWDAATRITDRGWIAEIRIPYDCLRFPAKDEQTWGICFSRFICRKNELDRWPFIPESAGGFVSNFGHLKGIRGLQHVPNIELLPYTVAYAERGPASDSDPDGRSYSLDAGFDIKYRLTSNIMLDGTINPDFGQVEADKTVLNLSKYETWFPEKRPFFLEGIKIFDTPFNLFYTRRIGHPPSLEPEGVDHYIDLPTETAILGAFKITGRTARGTSIGILEGVTQREEATYVDEDGKKRKGVVEPEANYLVVRLKRDVLENSSVGFVATAVNQAMFGPHYVSGLDWVVRMKNGDYKSEGQVVGSRSCEGEIDWGGLVTLEKEGGEHILGGIKAEYRGKNLDLNRLGFLDRNDYRALWLEIKYRTIDPWWIVRRSSQGIDVAYTENLRGTPLMRGMHLECQFQLSNFWMCGCGMWLDYASKFSDLETEGGPLLALPKERRWWGWFKTDESKRFAFGVLLSSGDAWDGRATEFRTGFEAKPKSNIEVRVEARYWSQDDVSRWLTCLEDEDGRRTDEIFGEENARRVDLTLRGTFTFTRDLTLQIYAQPFIASVDYRNFKRLIGHDRFEPVDRSVYDEEEEQPDFTWSSLNTNVILRWEYMPGSTLYLVWAHSRDNSTSQGEFAPAHAWDDLLAVAGENTLLAKISYRWTP